MSELSITRTLLEIGLLEQNSSLDHIKQHIVKLFGKVKVFETRYTIVAELLKILGLPNISARICPLYLLNDHRTFFKKIPISENFISGYQIMCFLCQIYGWPETMNNLEGLKEIAGKHKTSSRNNSIKAQNFLDSWLADDGFCSFKNITPKTTSLGFAVPKAGKPGSFRGVIDCQQNKAKIKGWFLNLRVQYNLPTAREVAKAIGKAKDGINNHEFKRVIKQKEDISNAFRHLNMCPSAIYYAAVTANAKTVFNLKGAMGDTESSIRMCISAAAIQMQFSTCNKFKILSSLSYMDDFKNFIILQPGQPISIVTTHFANAAIKFGFELATDKTQVMEFEQNPSNFTGMEFNTASDAARISDERIIKICTNMINFWAEVNPSLRTRQ